MIGFLETFHLPGTVELPLRGLPLLESALVWVTSRESAAIRAFASASRFVGSAPACNASEAMRSSARSHR